MAEKFALGVLVANKSGVLTRVSSLFARRGFNIDSLVVGETENPEYSRMTISATGDEYTKDQLVKQLSKLIDVVNVIVMDSDKTVYREMVLIKVSSYEKRSEILEAVSIYRGNVVDLSQETLTVALTGETAKLNAFIEYMRPYGIRELCRTGVSAMERGTKCLSGSLE